MNCPNCPAHLPADIHVIHGVDGNTKAECGRCEAVWDPAETAEERHAD